MVNRLHQDIKEHLMVDNKRVGWQYIIVVGRWKNWPSG